MDAWTSLGFGSLSGKHALRVSKHLFCHPLPKVGSQQASCFTTGTRKWTTYLSVPSQIYPSISTHFLKPSPHISVHLFIIHPVNKYVLNSCVAGTESSMGNSTVNKTNSISPASWNWYYKEDRHYAAKYSRRIITYIDKGNKENRQGRKWLGLDPF